jgi:hypothetical protein
MLNSKRIAARVVGYLQDRHGHSPSTLAIQRLVEVLFYSTLKTEEGRGVACTVAFITSDPTAVDAEAYGLRLHRRKYVALGTPISLTARSLAKFAQAAPPWASCIAVRAMNDQLEICGLFDQEIHYQNALNREGEPPFPRPGLFQVDLSGIGTLTVYHDRKLLARLSQNSLVTTFHDVLNEGPIASGLLRYIDKLEKRVRSNLRNLFKTRDVDSFLAETPGLWLQALSRILLGIRRSHHGGAILIIPAKPTKDLSVNFALVYDRMETNMERRLLASARWQSARNTMRTDYMEPTACIPAQLVQERRSAFNEGEDAKKAELGCVTLVSSLAGVDGLVLLSGGLRVIGFGVEIKAGKDPGNVFRAGNAVATRRQLAPLNLNDLGTRHRSMMRYCDRHPGSIGFVISQDGDVRAMTKTEAGLIVWDNIQLQEIEKPQQSLRAESQVRAILQRRDDIEKQLPRSQVLEYASRGGRLQLKLWLTLSADPLKLLIHTSVGTGFSEIQVVFDTEGDVFFVTTSSAHRRNDRATQVTETTQYFRFWRLIRMTRKTASLFPGTSLAAMKAVKEHQVDLSDFPENELHPSATVEQVEGAVSAIFANNRLTSRVTIRGEQGSFCFIQGTCSPTGRYALGFGLDVPDFAWQDLQGSCDLVFRREHYLASEGWEGAVRNYVVELETNKILGDTRCHYPGTRHNYSHRTCEAVWSPDERYLIQFFHGKWATREVSIVRLKAQKAVALSVLPTLKQHANQFLVRRKHRGFRRFGADQFALSVSCKQITKAGFVTFDVFGTIPGPAEGEATFSLIERFKILTDATGISLKLIECRFGDPLY